VAPLRLGGLRGKKSTPSVWLGGTGELIEVGKQEQEQLGGFSLYFGANFPSERFFHNFSIDLYCVESWVFSGIYFQALYLAINNKDFRHFIEQ
jgi:hypothetical protein